MDATHLHLLSNHVPVLAPVFGALILLVGLLLRRPDVMRVALALFVAGALGAAVTYTTGEPAEEHAEGAPGVSEAALEAHEDAGAGALAGNLLLGVGALALFSWSLWRPAARVGVAGRIVPAPAGSIPRLAATGLLVVSTVVIGWTAYAANLGGQIRHPDLRSASALRPGSGDDARGSETGEGRNTDAPARSTIPLAAEPLVRPDSARSSGAARNVVVRRDGREDENPKLDRAEGDERNEHER